MSFPTAVQAVSTLAVEASGSVSVFPVQSNAPFDSLCMSIVPIDGALSPYSVTVYHDGEILETHTFPDADRVVCHLSYPNMIFPANVGTRSIPKYHAQGANYPGIPIRVVIQNLDAERRSYLVYALYRLYGDAMFCKIASE